MEIFLSTQDNMPFAMLWSQYIQFLHDAFKTNLDIQ